MFIENKYTKWYFAIIENRKNHKAFGYCENHHIIPKSLGGNNSKDNIVSLTAKEHFICHRLLVKMTTGQDRVKMSFAIRCMMNIENDRQHRYKITSRSRELILKETKYHISEILSGENNPYYGMKHSDEVKEKMRAKRKLQQPPMLGKSHNSETRQKLREANRKQFEDPEQIRLRREKCNKIQGMKIYHTLDGNTKYYIEGTQPDGWFKGRPNKERR